MKIAERIDGQTSRRVKRALIGLARAVLLSLSCSLLVAVELKPGETVSIPFPDLPKTLAGAQAHLLVRLPAGYDQTRDCPIFLWLNGGNGSPGLNPLLAGEIPFILVSLPLFKRPDAPPEEVALKDADGEALGSAYRIMLAELDRLVPNRDQRRSIAGGFSNGANGIKVLSIKAPDLLHRFGGILLNDGGVFVTTAGGALIPGPGKDSIFDLTQLRDRRLLGVGAEKMAGRGLRELCELAKPAGVHATFVMMVGKGHAQVTEGDELKQTLLWVADLARIGIAESQAAMKAGVAAKKWPAAVVAYRDLARFYDPLVAGSPQVTADLALIQAASAQAAEKLATTAKSKDARTIAKDLRNFISTWQPMVTPAHYEQAEVLAKAELEKAVAAASISTRREKLRKMLADWSGFAAIETAVNAELAKLPPGKPSGKK